MNLGMELSEILEAQTRITKHVNVTPFRGPSHYFSELTGGNIYFKCENQQKAGSFKARGAYNKIRKYQETGKITHAICASTGNHSQGVAWAATRCGIPSTVVMSKNTPANKVQATRGYGATVVLHGEDFNQAMEHARELEKQLGATFIHAFNDSDIVAGQGTITLEILKKLPQTDVIVVPVGGGGLIAGIAIAAKKINSKIKVIGVQAEGACAAVKSYKTGKTVSMTCNTIAEAIAIKTPGDVTMPLIDKYVDQMVTVTDHEMMHAMVELLDRTKYLAEPAGAASLAAVINKKVDVTGKNVVCILSGGNLDMSRLYKYIEQVRSEIKCEKN